MKTIVCTFGEKNGEVNKPHIVCPLVGSMVWGCICFEAIGTLTQVNGNINAQNILKYLTKIYGPYLQGILETTNMFLWTTMPLFTGHVL